MKEKYAKRPLDFEIHANQFIHHVRGIEMKMKRQRRSLMDLTLKKVLPEWSHKFEKMENFLGEDISQFSREILRKGSDQLDQQTVDNCIVEVSAIGESRSHLYPFVLEVNSLAEKCGGFATAEFMGFRVTSDQHMEIRLVETGEGLFTKFFKFS